MPAARTTLPPPADLTELMDRARRIAGLPLGELADRLPGSKRPRESRRAKGWAGALIEEALGASGGSQAERDFPGLSVELKTLPIDRSGIPRESTYVCVVPLGPSIEPTWEDSWVRRKLDTVLWVPIVTGPGVSVSERLIGSPLLWRMEADLDAWLRRDWEDLMELVTLGRIDEITGHDGVYLQIRPKAANGRALTRYTGPAGEPTMTLPRGFYLRPSFTKEVLRRHYAL